MNELVATMCLSLCLLGGCHKQASVPNPDAPIPANAIGDSPSNSLDPDRDAGSIEARRRAALPVPDDGMAWRWDAQAGAARFGVPPSGTSFAIGCNAGRVVLRRFDAAPRDAKATMSFTGNGRVASLPARSVGDPAALSSLWEAAEPPSDRTAAVARVFDGPGPVEISLAGTTALVTRASSLPMRAFQACR